MGENMTHGSLYSGIGGWLLAARWAEIENIFTVEIDDFCNKVLKKHFNVEQYKDIKEFSGEKHKGTIDILSTSDPCQPFSFAGKRGGTTDDRYLWSETIRIIREIRPTYVVFENVPGFISMAFETVASDLETEGYTVESFIIPACAVGAWHRRDRLWVIAYIHGGSERQFQAAGNNRTRFTPNDKKVGRLDKAVQSIGLVSPQKDPPHSDSEGLEGCFRQSENRCSPPNEFSSYGRWDRLPKPNIRRGDDGFATRVHRLKSLGNSIVPQIAYIIFEAIKNVGQH